LARSQDEVAHIISEIARLRSSGKSARETYVRLREFGSRCAIETLIRENRAAYDEALNYWSEATPNGVTLPTRVRLPLPLPTTTDPLASNVPDARQCRWPIGEPRTSGFHYCYHARVPGKSYCPEHEAAKKEVGYAPKAPQKGNAVVVPNVA